MLKPRVSESKTFSRSGAEFQKLPTFSKTTAKIPKPLQFRKPIAEDTKPPRFPKSITGDDALSKVRVAEAAKPAGGKDAEDFVHRPPGASASAKTRASTPREMDRAKATGTNTGKHITKDEDFGKTIASSVDKSARTHKSKDILAQAATANGLWKMPTAKIRELANVRAAGEAKLTHAKTPADQDDSLGKPRGARGAAKFAQSIRNRVKNLAKAQSIRDKVKNFAKARVSDAEL